MLRWVDRKLKYIFIMPTVIFMLLMISFPLLYTLYLSFTEWSLGATPPKWIGLKNYTSIFTDPRFLDAVGRTFYFSVVGIMIETIMGILIAVLLNRKFVGKNLAKAFYMLPVVATPVAIGMVWVLIYQPTIGVANRILNVFGIPPQAFLGDLNQVMNCLILVDVWQWTPVIMLIVLAGLTAIPVEPYESAEVDGANSWQKFWNITLPLVSQSILVAMLLRLIDIIKTFDLIYSTTQGGPVYQSENINILAAITAFFYFQFGRTSAMIIVFFIVVVLISGGFILIKKRLEVDY